MATQATRLRLGISGVVLALSILMIAMSVGHSDLVQDYAAAWGWWHGHNPNSPILPLLTTCCPATIEPLRNLPTVQTAHPPVATLILLPLVWMPFEVVRGLWLLLSWAVLVWAWQRARTPPAVCAATACLWVMVLQLGAFEAILFCLLVLAFSMHNHAPGRAGVLLGLAAALKIYPVLLLVGLILGRQRRMASAMIGTGLAAVVLAEAVLGWGVTRDWLAYVPRNTALFLDSPVNLSVVHLVHLMFPGVSTVAAALAGLVVLTIPLLPRLRRGDFQAMLPVMLLVLPLSWLYYAGLLTATKVGRLEQFCLALSSVLLLAGAMQLVGGVALAVTALVPMHLVLPLAWYRLAHPRAFGVTFRLEPTLFLQAFRRGSTS